MFSFQGYTWKRSQLRAYVEQFMPAESAETQIARLTAAQNQNRLRDDALYDDEPDQTNASYAFTSFRADEGEFADVMRDTTGGGSERGRRGRLATHRGGGGGHDDDDDDDGLPTFLSAHMASAARARHRVPVDQIAMGGTGSGLHWHSHGDAWNTIVVGGHKLWLLVAPGSQAREELRSHQAWTGLQWWKRAHEVEVDVEHPGDHHDDDDDEDPAIVPRAPEGVLSCVLGEGEIMFVPRGWLHATINLGHVVARSQRLGRAGRKDATDSWNLAAIVGEMGGVCNAEEEEEEREGDEQEERDSGDAGGGSTRSSAALAEALQRVARRVEIMLEPDFMRAACTDEGAWVAFQRVVARCRNVVLKKASLRALEIEALAQGGAVAQAANRAVTKKKKKKKKEKRKRRRAAAAAAAARDLPHKVHLHAIRNVLDALERFVECARPPFAPPPSQLTALQAKRKRRLCPKPGEALYGARCDMFDANMVKQMMVEKNGNF